MSRVPVSLEVIGAGASSVSAWWPRRNHAGATTVKQLSARKFAKRAGTIMLGLVALDLVATLATLALGWGFLKR
jgi:uncharacterized iron-regulated membrane protein